MVKVANTKKLEELFNGNIRIIPDEEQILIKGGLDGKAKYNNSYYMDRVTYSGKQVKQIINIMRKIEEKIPNDFNDIQKAKFIYTTLAKGIKYSKSNGKDARNLTALISREGVCAGYALIFKEMMDRQGIECDYVRGIGITPNETGKHAWNVVHIGGKSYPIDLTWDSLAITIDSQARYFALDTNFEKRHIPEVDEKKRNFSYLSRIDYESININQNEKSISNSEAYDILRFGIEQTYEKFKKLYGEEKAKEQVIRALSKYILEGDARGFTSQNGARQKLEGNLSKSKTIYAIASKYAEDVNNTYTYNEGSKIFSNGVKSTADKHGIEFTTESIAKFIRNDDLSGFTRDNNSRQNIASFISKEAALQYTIRSVVENEITKISEHEYNEEKNTQLRNKHVKIENDAYIIKADDFGKVSKPPKEVFDNALRWVNAVKENQNKSNLDYSKDSLKNKNDLGYQR